MEDAPEDLVYVDLNKLIVVTKSDELDKIDFICKALASKIKIDNIETPVIFKDEDRERVIEKLVATIEKL